MSTVPLSLDYDATHHHWYRLALPGRVVLSWTMAGGVFAGGFLLSSLLITDPSTSGAALTVSLLLFAMGAAAGFVHGAVLAVLGRRRHEPLREALGEVGVGALWAIPGTAAAGVLTVWISMMAVAFMMDSWSIVAGVVVAWLLGGAVCVWAASEGWRALTNTFSRWPEYRSGTIVLSVSFGLLLAVFLSYRPEIWWTDVRVTGLGALLLAAGATIWIMSPIVVLTLHIIRRIWPAEEQEPRG